MASNPGPADAANTAVRAFLWQAGAEVWGSRFNVKSKAGSRIWDKIKQDVFDGECMYCGVKDSDTNPDGSVVKLTVEHIEMANRFQTGIHHPGNVGPACKSCQSRKTVNNLPESWEDVVRRVNQNNPSVITERIERISHHMTQGEFRLPILSSEQKNALSIICHRLYDDAADEVRGAVVLYKALLTAFVEERNPVGTPDE
ncbi:MAG: HNH endonuclease [Candidatus Poseidoniaceae archaeon]